MKKLAIITTHPIQYYAPVFKLLSERQRVAIKVFYTLGQQATDLPDKGFKQNISWDLPLLDGYEFEWLKNTANSPGSHHFKGIVNPDGISRIRQYQPDALLVFGWAYYGHLKIIHHFSNKVPVYFRGDSTMLLKSGILKQMLRTVFLKWVYRHIDHAFYVGMNNKHYFEEYGLTGRHLSFAPHAVDNERFAADRTPEAGELRSSLGLNSHDILVLYAGKFEPVKNLPLLLSAFSILDRRNVHLLLAGSGSSEEELRTAAAGRGNIHFTGFKNQSYMPVLYQAADLFCLSSKSETWGLSVNEAMACGKAILTSDQVGCAADLVNSKRNGAVFESENVNSLVEKLKQMTENRDLLVTFGQQSSSIIKSWNFDEIAQAIENKLLCEDSSGDRGNSTHL
ncbi:glycosyltransferase family 4 protein [Mucilaginibacter flavidus]|uniref:glycosyltransferase family 4 protein n=1 Tax=Mucilaginibacter flavidus TaxID=2949309 RepID=UPI0020930899|nr:glycosyltransferase family 4 protein [Mucilaginibacter flavidus]MCO5947687.1 glycosyltransferase family 4 protein [Mucilaginibacter flavidus]